MPTQNDAAHSLGPRGGTPASSGRSASESLPTPILICFSHLRWDFVFQRPQHLLTRAARDFDVYFVEEPVYVPGVHPHYAVRKIADRLHCLVPTLSEGHREPDLLLRSLLDELVAGIATNNDLVFWYYTPLALSFSAHITPSLVIYDNMDELSAFRGASRSMLQFEDLLLASADLVFTGGVSLYEAKRHRHPDIHAFPSSVDVHHFHAARRAPAEPHDQAGLARPRLGYFGVIDERMDLALVETVASSRPAWQLIMVGPIVKIDPLSVPHLSNIHWLGMKGYPELPSYLGGWDVGIMPFALNEATRFISPTKTPEFLAAGLPVVSTAIADVIAPYGDAGLVQIARSPGEFVERCEEQLMGWGENTLARVDAFLASGSWDDTWRRMMTLIDQHLRASGNGFRARDVEFHV